MLGSSEEELEMAKSAKALADAEALAVTPRISCKSHSIVRVETRRKSYMQCGKQQIQGKK